MRNVALQHRWLPKEWSVRWRNHRGQHARELCRTHSASWLTNAAFIRKLAYEPERLYKRGTNMEGASFLLFQVKGSVKVKSMDMLDIFIEHLSW